MRTVKILCKYAPHVSVSLTLNKPSIMNTQGKIKLLFLAANPRDTAKLDLDEEMRAITNQVRIAEDRNLLSVISGWAVRSGDLIPLLNQHKPEIVHFSGHGSPQGELCLVDEFGNSNPVSARALQALFDTVVNDVKVVVLNACYSKLQGEAIAEKIDYVVGMNTAIGDKAAITFAATFYQSLCFNKTIEEAFNQAKVSLMLEGIAEENTPELIIKKSGVAKDKSLSSITTYSVTNLLKQYTTIFERPAFWTPCINELFLSQLTEAVDDIQSAFNSGRLYSRSGKLLADVTPIRDIEDVKIREVFTEIRSDFITLKREIVDFENTFRRLHPKYSGGENFYFMLRELPRHASKFEMHDILNNMDNIDKVRNSILSKFNSVLDTFSMNQFNMIPISTHLIRKGSFPSLSELENYI